MISASEFVSEDKGAFKRLVNSFMPASAVIPLQSECEEISPFVKVGDKVTEGQLIAASSDFSVHASVPGTVSEISTAQFGNGKQGMAVKIKLGGSFTFVGKKENIRDWSAIPADELAIYLKDYGVVNTVKDCVPIFPEIRKLAGKTSILAVRLFDDDPSRVSESFIAENMSEKVVEGASILAKILNVKAIVFVYEKNRANARKIYSSFNEENSDSVLKITDAVENIKVFSVPVDVKKYPSGTISDMVSSTKTAVKSIFKKNPELFEIVSKFSSRDFFIDPQTAVSIYDAVVLRKPVISRYVHVTGEALNAAAMINVKIGTSFRQLVEQCGGLKKRLAKIVVNGIVLGYSAGSLDIPVTKMVKSVEFVPDSDISVQHSESCVRCGQCRKICPVNLWPGNVYRVFKMIQRGELDKTDSTDAVLASSKICIECGLCNSVCPSRLPLRQTIGFARNDLK